MKKTRQASTAKQDRQQRLNIALRENLLKRKQQSRTRQKQQKIPIDSLAGQIKGMQN